MSLTTFPVVARKLIAQGPETAGQILYSFLSSPEPENLVIAQGVARALAEIDHSFSVRAWEVCNNLMLSEIEAMPLQGPFNEPDPEFN